MANQNPEQIARDNIDKQLITCGWLVQNKKQINLNAGPGVAVKEYQTEVGPADYVLFVDGKPIGIIEAKREEQGEVLSTHEDQVSLIRKVAGIDAVLTPYDKTVDKNFQTWLFKKQAGALKFSKEQMEWLYMLKDQIATSVHVDIEDLDYTPFDASGGRGRMWQLFGENMETILNELNEALAA
ncbi:hypothetical protein KKF34_12295 [Myxococcota bacterium]|nr:hypothetical protein [Myxococcota bacterium]MBU1381728.1 hypothetical protein [Myxococcota bacterium]MBU1497645.1 hypothetical protein [Myxococcota bacterium]